MQRFIRQGRDCSCSSWAKKVGRHGARAGAVLVPSTSVLSLLSFIFIISWSYYEFNLFITYTVSLFTYLSRAQVQQAVQVSFINVLYGKTEGLVTAERKADNMRRIGLGETNAYPGTHHQRQG